MRLRIKCLLTRSFKSQVEEGRSVAEMLQSEKNQFDETLNLILNDPETIREVEMTMIDEHGFPLGQISWGD